MATRFYLPSSGTPPSGSPAVDSGWDYSIGNFDRYPCYDSKQSTGMATIALDGNSDTADTDYCFGQWISEPLADAA